MPSRRLPKTLKQHCKHLALADPEFDQPAPIDLLLEADVFSQVLDGKRISLGNSLPTAFSSIFGWIIIGPVSDVIERCWESNVVSLTVSLENVVSRFWQIEEPEPAPSTFTEEGQCEEIYVKERQRNSNGRFSVPLPFRGDISDECFPGSRQMALRRFENLERKFKTDPALHTAYKDFMQEYLALDHMSISSEDGVYYIPHHAVFKSGPDSKIRVVFDASAPSANGRSLNSRLHTGPKLQQDIVDILLRFRVHRWALTADVCKMYRQIQTNPSYRRFQHIFWRESPLDKLQEFELNTVTYGVNCAPYLALRMLKDIAEHDCQDFPTVRTALQFQTYVDDICVGADSPMEIVQLQSDLVTVLKRAGFELKKWMSNRKEILDAIPAGDCALNSLQFSDEGSGATKVLGIQWRPHLDVFSYDVQLPVQTSTKRGVLSVIARIFDPLGSLAPTIFHAKHLMQLIWRSNLTWDAPLPPEIADQWHAFVTDLPALSATRIPRHIGTATFSHVQLCGFCDASERGYAAVVYLRCVDCKGTTIVSLLGSKTKMAPIKSSTMPRLELCAALLLARWMSRVRNTLETKLRIDNVYAWSDSQIVLSWISNPHTVFKVFVSNRVYQLQQLLPSCIWNYVSSAENPADCASRGLLPSELVQHTLYWHGPQFLHESPINWSSAHPVITVEQLPETKTVTLTTTIEDVTGEWFNRFSSYTKAVRLVALMLRFTGRCRRQTYQHSFLSTAELQQSLDVIVRASQQWAFKDLIHAIKQGSRLPRQYAVLRPTIDTKGIIRVGGRLRHADISERQKHPILLAKNSHLSLLLARHWHLYTCHGGPRVITSLVSRQFWIVSVRVLIRSVISRCTICVRIAAQNPQPLMADLPASRVQPCRPFSRIGVDYAGPLPVRESRLRKARQYKAYIAVFVCLSVKAVHLELVTELSTNAFLAAFDRFVALRGLPSDVYSDCGTNFVGAAKQLRDLVNQPENHHSITAHAMCSWHFNPPGAPHFGGLWEAAVRSTKSLLIRTIGCHNTTFEELSTLLYRVEAVLNSRPLTPMSTSPDDLDYLSPGHFLIGQPLLTVPHKSVSEETKNVVRWKFLHQCH